MTVTPINKKKQQNRKATKKSSSMQKMRAASPTSRDDAAQPNPPPPPPLPHHDNQRDSACVVSRRPSPSPPPPTEEKVDAYLGRGGGNNQKRDHSLYQRLLEENWEDYFKITGSERDRKRKFAQERIIRPIQNVGGNFFRKNRKVRINSNGKGSEEGEQQAQEEWVRETNEKEIQTTVMQALRDKGKGRMETSTMEEPKVPAEVHQSPSYPSPMTVMTTGGEEEVKEEEDKDEEEEEEEHEEEEEERIDTRTIREGQENPPPLPCPPLLQSQSSTFSRVASAVAETFVNNLQQQQLHMPSPLLHGVRAHSPEYNFSTAAASSSSSSSAVGLMRPTPTDPHHHHRLRQPEGHGFVSTSSAAAAAQDQCSGGRIPIFGGELPSLSSSSAPLTALLYMDEKLNKLEKKVKSLEHENFVMRLRLGDVATFACYNARQQQEQDQQRQPNNMETV